MTIAHEIGGQKPLAEVLRGLQRYIDMTAAASPMQIPGEPVSAPTLRSADASDVRLWRIALRAWRDHRLSEPPGNLNALEAPAWSRWAQNILGYFTGTPPVITLEDLVLAAADRPPATLFQRDLGRLGIRDWTNLCLHGARQAADFDPQVTRPIHVTAAWAIIAGLRALHSSRELFALGTCM